MTNRTALVALLVASNLPILAHSTNATDPEQLFQEAMQLRDTGYVYPAIDLFQSILDQQPGLQRARLELAVAYHRARRFQEARDQLTRVYNDSGTPEAVKLAITAYLAQLGSDEKATRIGSSTSTYVSAGLFTDSNVNLGPSPELANASVSEIDGTGMTVMASLSHLSRAAQPLQIRERPVDFEWRTQASAYAKMYSGAENDYNVHVLSFYTGPALVDNGNWRAVLNFRMEKMYFDADPYSFNLGVNPAVTWTLGNNLDLSLDLLTTVRDFSSQANRGLDGTANDYTLSVTKFFSDLSVGVEAGVKYHDNGADAAYLHAQGGEVFVAGQAPAWKGARVYLQLSSRNYDYLAADPATSDPSRDETERQAIVGVSHSVASGALKSWTLNTQITYTENDANVAIFEYDRTLFEINMRSYF